MTGPDRGMEARIRTTTAVHGLAVELHGPDVVIPRPLSGMSSTLRDVTPLAGIDAARLVQAQVARMLREYAERARGEGTSWADLAEPLGLTTEAADHDLPPAEAAYGWVALGLRPGQQPTEQQGRDWLSYPPVARWDCSSCGARITDNGPDEGHPANRETGHVPGCTRFAGELAEYERDWDTE